jgi:hypothetical protein
LLVNQNPAIEKTSPKSPICQFKKSPTKEASEIMESVPVTQCGGRKILSLKPNCSSNFCVRKRLFFLGKKSARE